MSTHHAHDLELSRVYAEMGWADSDGDACSSALLLLATGLCFLSTWAVAGFHPLAGLATRFRFGKDEHTAP